MNNLYIYTFNQTHNCSPLSPEVTTHTFCLISTNGSLDGWGIGRMMRRLELQSGAVPWGSEKRVVRFWWPTPLPLPLYCCATYLVLGDLGKPSPSGTRWKPVKGMAQTQMDAAASFRPQCR